MKIRKANKTIINLIIIIILSQIITAQTYYIDDNNCSDANPGTYDQPWCTFQHSFSQMQSGDELVVKDGYYNLVRNGQVYDRIYGIPGGTPNNYTIIRAEHDGGATIDGSFNDRIGYQELNPYTAFVITVSNNYIRIEGLKFINGYQGVALFNGNYTEIKRTAFANTLPNHNVVQISGRHILMEDSWVWGTGNVGIMFYGGQNICQGSGHEFDFPQYDTLRRVVVRTDESADSGGSHGIIVYGGQDLLLENVIVLDSAANTVPSAGNYRTGIRVRRSDCTENMSFYGTIVLNLPRDISNLGYSGYEFVQTNCQDCIAWDTGGISFFEASWQNGFSITRGTAHSTQDSTTYFKAMTCNDCLIDPDPATIRYLPSPATTGGARIENKYYNGILTSEPLWPWPYQDRLYNDMCDPTFTLHNGQPITMRGFCLKNSLTEYIWEYLGYSCPTNICGAQTPECSDNQDNDGDGLTDLADPGCSTTTDNDETNCGDGVCENPIETAAICPTDCPCTDNDGDNYYAEGGACGQTDCDDTNNQINPGMSEVCGNNIDDNCDGNRDEGCPVQELIIDNTDPEFSTTGNWPTLNTYAGYYGQNFQYNLNNDGDTARWTPNLPTGNYDIYVNYVSDPQQSTTNAEYNIHHTTGTSTITIDQTTGGGTWQYLGTWQLDQNSYIELTDSGATATTAVVADAIRLVANETQTGQPICGNNQIETGEQCDDGNTITETCTYGQTSCQVCDSNCQLIQGATSYCGDNICDQNNENQNNCPQDCNTITPDCGQTNILCVDDTPGQTQEYQTIQEAANNAAPGDTIIIHPGNYAGFTITNSGTTNNPITYQALPGATINNPNSNGDGITINNANHLIIDGFTIENLNGDCLSTHQASPTNPMRGLTIRNNRCTNAGGIGFYLSEVSESIIENNNITNAGFILDSHGIYLANAGSDNTIIRKNIINNTAAGGIHINGDLSVGGDGIISGLIIEGNIITGAGTNGLNMDGVQDSIIRNNIIYSNARHAIRAYTIDGAEGPRNLTIINNDLIADNGFPIKLSEDQGGHTIFNNILISPQGSLVVGTSNLVSDYNIISTNPNPYSLNEEATMISLTEWRNNGLGTHSQTADLQTIFNNYPQDFSLRTGSPAIDSGISNLNNIQAPTTDINGITRPQGTTTDIGAYEANCNNCIQGDFNNDQIIDINDFWMLSNYYLTSTLGDLNNDQITNLLDLVLFGKIFG